MNKKFIVYSLLKKVPKGYVVSYGALAKKAGISPRAVGYYMKNNKDPINIPCYKVIYSNGRIGNYGLGMNKKISLLKKEGIKIINGKIDKKYFLKP